MKKLFLFLILMGCAVEPVSQVSAIGGTHYLLGLHPVDNAEVAGGNQAHALYVCPVLAADTDTDADADTDTTIKAAVKDKCKQALVTKSNRPVLFTTVYPEISQSLGNKEFYTLLAPAIAITPLVAKILRTRNLKTPNLSKAQLQALMQRSNRIVAGVGVVSIATIALLYLFESHTWGADKRELARLQQDIFNKNGFEQVRHTDRSIQRLLTLLAASLDLQVSREAKLMLATQ